MSRERQRQNRRKKAFNQEKPWLNSEGYHDPTAFQALRNLERQKTAPKPRT